MRSHAWCWSPSRALGFISNPNELFPSNVKLLIRITSRRRSEEGHGRLLTRGRQVIATGLQQVPGDAMGTPQGSHGDSRETPRGRHGDAMGTPCGHHRDSTGTPCRCHRDAMGRRRGQGGWCHADATRDCPPRSKTHSSPKTTGRAMGRMFESDQQQQLLGPNKVAKGPYLQGCVTAPAGL